MPRFDYRVKSVPTKQLKFLPILLPSAAWFGAPGGSSQTPQVIQSEAGLVFEDKFDLVRTVVVRFKVTMKSSRGLTREMLSTIGSAIYTSTIATTSVFSTQIRSKKKHLPGRGWNNLTVSNRTPLIGMSPS